MSFSNHHTSSSFSSTSTSSNTANPTFDFYYQFLQNPTIQQVQPPPQQPKQHQYQHHAPASTYPSSLSHPRPSSRTTSSRSSSSSSSSSTSRTSSLSSSRPVSSSAPRNSTAPRSSHVSRPSTNQLPPLKGMRMESQRQMYRELERRDEAQYYVQGTGGGDQGQRSNLPSIHQLLSSADPGPKVWRVDCEVGVWRG